MTKIIEIIFFMLKSYLSAWKRPFDFNGLSNRKEYWSFNLLNIILIPILSYFIRIIQGVLGNTAFLFLDNQFLSVFLFVLIKTFGIFAYLLVFGSMWSSIPLTVRRIRDAGMSWQWIFVALIPLVGNLFALISLTRKSTRLSIKEEKI
mgnify:CR=1 FL=1